MVYQKPSFTEIPLKNSVAQRQCYICGSLRCLLKSHEALARRIFSQTGKGAIHQIDNAKPDPFAKHPIPMCPELEKLYAQGWTRWDANFNGPERHLFPYPMCTAIFRHGWKDEALHYGVLSVIATQISLLQNGSVNELALDLQIKTIATQREALTRGGYSDARILTSLCILSNSCASNRPDDRSSHMHLITSCLQKRGGLHYLGFDGVIADSLMYMDFICSITNNQIPHYPVTLPAIPSICAPRPGPHYEILKVMGLLSQEVTVAANNYIVMVNIYDRAARSEVIPSEATYFAYLAHVLEYQLACANALYRDTNTLEECITLACILGNVVLMRNCGQISPIAWTVEDRLWRCLERTKESILFRRPELCRFEWYLTCIGMITATRGKCKYEQKVIEELVRFRRNPYQPLKDYEELCRTMDDYGWCRSPCLSLFSRVWNESSRLLFDPGKVVELAYRPAESINHGSMY